MATITNYWPNPSMEANTSSYGSRGITPDRVALQPYSGTYALRMVTTASGQGFTGGGTIVPAAQGQVWTCALYMAGTGTFRVGLIERTSGGEYVADSAGGGVAATETHRRLVFTRTLTGGTTAFVTPYFEQVGAGSNTVYVDAVMMVEGDVAPDYFDGDSPNAVWTGTPHASTSVLTLPDTSSRMIHPVLKIGAPHIGPLRVGERK